MEYQISFASAVTPELAHLLHAVQKQLNSRGIHAQGGETASSAASVASGASSGVSTDNTHPLHDPNVVVVGSIALVVGLVVGYAVGKSSTPSSSKTQTAT